MTDRRRKGGPLTGIGGLCAIPLLLSLLLYAAVYYQCSVACAYDETWKRREVYQEIVRLREQILHLTESLRRHQAQMDELGRLRAEVAGRESSQERLREEYRRLQHEILLASKRLEKLEELEAKVDAARKSKQDLDKRAKELEEETRRIRQQIDGLVVELDKQPKPGASRFLSGRSRQALFVECDKSGAKLMPEGRLLGPDAKPAEQKLLVDRAKAMGLVFLVIRPDGFEVFATYRHILEPYRRKTGKEKIDVGFEFAGKDTRLHYLKIGDYMGLAIEHGAQEP
jgi:hypothetical protein